MFGSHFVKRLTGFLLSNWIGQLMIAALQRGLIAVALPCRQIGRDIAGLGERRPQNPLCLHGGTAGHRPFGISVASQPDSSNRKRNMGGRQGYDERHRGRGRRHPASAIRVSETSISEGLGFRGLWTRRNVKRCCNVISGA